MYIGDLSITQLYLGDNDPSAAYLGDLPIYPVRPFSGFQMTSSIEFDKDGGNKQIRIKSHTTWEIGTDANWLSLSQTTGSGNTYVTVTATDNDTESARTATITGQTLDTIYSDQCDVEQAYRIQYEKMYFTTVSLVDNNTIKLDIPSALNTSYATSVSYSTDNGANWTTTNVNNTNQTIAVSVNSGDSVLWKGIANTYSTARGASTSQSSRMYASGNFEVEGNAMSLVYGDDFATATTLTGANTFCAFFMSATTLQKAENLVLPATSITTGNYSAMFRYCTAMTYGPKVLPAPNAGTDTYRGMFYYCPSLIESPIISASTGGSYALAYMFEYCNALIKVTCLLTSKSSNTTDSWFNNRRTNTGTFYKSSGYTGWGTGASGIPNGWTVLDYSE